MNQNTILISKVILLSILELAIALVGTYLILKWLNKEDTPNPTKNSEVKG